MTAGYVVHHCFTYHLLFLRFILIIWSAMYQQCTQGGANTRHISHILISKIFSQWQRTLVLLLHTYPTHPHLGGGCVTLLADPAVSCLLGGLLQRGVQTPKVIAEPALVTPAAEGGRVRVIPHINKAAVFLPWWGQLGSDDGWWQAS